MAKRRRGHNEGTIDKRNGKPYRIRYTINDRRYCKAFTGTVAEAKEKIRELLHKGDTGQHIEPDKITVSAWIDQWIAAGAPRGHGKRRKPVGQRAVERYEQLLNEHVKPALGGTRLQQLQATNIDALYDRLKIKVEAKDLSARTAHHVHIVFNSCLGTAQRRKLISVNPMSAVERTPDPEARQEDADSDEGTDTIGEGLSPDELKALITGFRQSPLYPVVALAAATGARRGELLALRWCDLSVESKTLRIEWALEQTKKHGIRRKRPKTKRGWRTIDIDDATLEMLLDVRDKHLRIAAGIPDGVDVDLSLVKLPAEALIFPATPAPGLDFSFTAWRNPRNFSKEFARRAGVIGFGATRFHDLRGIHGTALLDAGTPVHIVAQRIGDDPAVLLRNYVKRQRTKQAAENLASTISGFVGSFLGK
ncbi:tyrosine-type recombinase/integrase [Bradyrhizobium sp. AZCC 1721]|uniref:tyrosine-type recombinase/integrase n=1 Tax=Bradyrhizobium sp. AZCC 1721 TaxID=3117016 RepID=UPI002FF1E5F6